METKTETEDEAGKQLVELVSDYVAITDKMSDLIERTFANSEEVKRVVREVKKDGVKLIDSVSAYTKAVDCGLNGLKMIFGVTK